MLRKAFVMQLRAGQREEYRRRHQPIWPELAAVLRAHGVRNYSIHLHPWTLQLFAYAEVESDARWAAIAQTPECQKWWAHMRELMETHPDDSRRAWRWRRCFFSDAKNWRSQKHGRRSNFAAHKNFPPARRPFPHSSL